VAALRGSPRTPASTHGKQLLHHPRSRRVPVPKRRHREQGRFPAGRPPDPGSPQLHPPARESEFRRHRAPVAMGALRLMRARGSGQGPGLLAKPLVQRGQPVHMDRREQVLARGASSRRASAPPGAAAPASPHSLLACAARSLRSRCSLRPWRLLGPGGGHRLSWSTRFSRRPGEPSLFSSQVQPGWGGRVQQTRRPLDQPVRRRLRPPPNAPGRRTPAVDGMPGVGRLGPLERGLLRAPLVNEIEVGNAGDCGPFPEKETGGKGALAARRYYAATARLTQTRGEWHHPLEGRPRGVVEPAELVTLPTGPER
jgi:hypothetical protein